MKCIQVFEVPPGLDVEAWCEWVEYRHGRGKPLNPKSYKTTMKQIASWGGAQRAQIERSITNSWIGVFPPKNKDLANSAEKFDAQAWAARHD